MGHMGHEDTHRAAVPRAAEEFRAAGPIYAREVREVEAWIAAQPRP